LFCFFIVNTTGPLSAYNLFFKEERIKMLQELGAEVPSDNDDDDDEEEDTTGTSASIEEAYKDDAEEGSNKQKSLQTIQEEKAGTGSGECKVGDDNDESSANNSNNKKRPPSKMVSNESQDKDPRSKKAKGGDKKKKETTTTSKKKKKRNSVGFAVMAKAISARWKAIDQESLARYTAMATTEKARYKSEVDAYQLRKLQEMERNREHLEASLDETTKEAYFLSMSKRKSKDKK
jgi:HMG-box domain